MFVTLSPYCGIALIVLYLIVWLWLGADEGRENRKAARQAKYDAFEAEQAAKVAADAARYKASKRRA